jgi:protocatechuate 3,4-dioxygenase beta subunit
MNPLSRREILRGGAAGLALLAGGPLLRLWTVRGAFAEELVRTPRQTEGPFYPDRLPLDTDNDLLLVNDAITPAVGEVTHLTGRVLSSSGEPVANAVVEIWQCDSNGRYHHPADRRGPADPNFQGYGRALTDADGAYRFRTIRPAPYPGRTPHIHFAVTAAGFPKLVTQMYVAGEPGNERDGVLQAVRDAAARRRLLVELTPASHLEPDALAGRFDIVLGA